MLAKISFFFCFFCAGFLVVKAGNLPAKSALQKFEFDDIEKFWVAVDSLKNAHTKDDSLQIIDKFYLNRMSRSGKKFISIKKYTAVEYLNTIKRYPLYLAELRLKTNHLIHLRTEIKHTFDKLKAVIPGFKIPDLCFVIGCFRGGGTTQNNTIFIGAEIALADSTMEDSEFSGWLKTVLSNADGNVAALIAHESIHCNEYDDQYGTLPTVLSEGLADFLPALILNTNINKLTYAYGLVHECELWEEFEKSIEGKDYSKWLYNAGSTKDRPADLGYFIGRQIHEAYYNGMSDKKQAIKNMLNGSKYIQILQLSNYHGNCSQ